MSKADKNEQIDDDILQSQADVLRARDIIPGSKDAEGPSGASAADETGTGEKPKTEEGEEKAGAAAGQADKASEKEQTISQAEMDVRAEPTGPVTEKPAAPEKSEIPQFDLAEQIMSEQRKVASARRRAPGREADSYEQEGIRAEPASRPVEDKKTELSHADRIVAQIVKRDIERLCRSDNSSGPG